MFWRILIKKLKEFRQEIYLEDFKPGKLTTIHSGKEVITKTLSSK